MFQQCGRAAATNNIKLQRFGYLAESSSGCRRDVCCLQTVRPTRQRTVLKFHNPISEMKQTCLSDAP